MRPHAFADFMVEISGCGSLVYGRLLDTEF
jgi:hypothetical protein